MPDYTIDALAKGLKVLEALEGSRYEAVTVQRIADRCKQNYNYCYRALKTFQKLDFAHETADGKWMLGKRVLRLSEGFAEAVKLN